MKLQRAMETRQLNCMLTTWHVSVFGSRGASKLLDRFRLGGGGIISSPKQREPPLSLRASSPSLSGGEADELRHSPWRKFSSVHWKRMGTKFGRGPKQFGPSS